jgi:hypothetical protein
MTASCVLQTDEPLDTEVGRRRPQRRDTMKMEVFMGLVMLCGLLGAVVFWLA